MNRALHFLTFILLTTVFGCSRATIDNPDYIIAHVDSTRHIHWGRGFYKLKVYYSFQETEVTFTGVYEHKLEKAYTSKYEPGDSVLVKFDSEKPDNNELIKIVYNNQN